MSDKILGHSFTIRHLSNEEGGGYLIEFPDLPGCMSDGETIDEAIRNGRDAILAWIESAKKKTVKALQDADKRKTHKAKSVDDLFKDLE